MHTVSQSAESPAWRRRIARQQEIHAAACRLVVERGYYGFTMDDLAGAVGVSRRTLFNHVPDKASAVLGGEEGRVHGAVGEFIARRQPTFHEAFVVVADSYRDVHSRP